MNDLLEKDASAVRVELKEAMTSLFLSASSSRNMMVNLCNFEVGSSEDRLYLADIHIALATLRIALGRADLLCQLLKMHARATG